ncbi:chromosome segregation protein SMC [Sporolactobacillus putidus]|uniref:Chromosome partition protein Smc n=1 Tax=Sporolactobacillus putidus TaxID=492735 RepID=A0A917VZL9_9BACL|nr:chromosome segregation protein SMC [Sporolactobacillus putidus]GGL44264.1 chromosome partition protein Smc [Sporolactobacillus putidus]
MYLKRLDVSGFKSFANKTSVEFVPGVTAVVGPNGSGKSNITEAIRWVLGEQSAKSLRGSKMEDIIFSGSDAKKAVNMAEVALTLDNADHYLPFDYSEISVTRRVFRSGDSEFLLNRQSCRLKDIVDLFMDSGLGKEAYSVIGQGKIDEILNSKAEDKRKIFEEASGVLKYKLRKQTAEKQLEESAVNLNRVEDILHELSSRLGPLEQQASTAREYLAKKEELEKVDVALLVYDIGDVHARWSASKSRAENLNQRKKEIALNIEEKEKLFRSNREALDVLDRDIDLLQSRWAESGEILEKMLGQKEVAAERRKHAKSSALELKERIGKLEEQLEDERRALRNSESAYQAEHLKLEELRKRLKEKLTAFSGFEQNLDETIERLKADYIEVLNQQASMRNEQRYLSDQQKSLLQKKNRVEANSEDVRKIAGEARKRKDKLVSEMKRQADEGTSLQKSLAECESQLEKEHARYSKQKEALDKIARFIEQAVSRKEMLEALKEEYAGFNQGVKAILKKRHEISGIHGAVAELIRVEKTYGTAVETALGASSQHVIVSDEASGRNAIHFLRSHQAGRATFLPVSVMKARSLPYGDRKRISEHPDFVGTAEELVSCDPAYREVIGHLLGAVVVARNLAGANALSKILGYRYRIVTLEGDIVAPGGAMTGGSLRQNRAGLIGRAAEIDQLTGQIGEMRAKSEQLKHDFAGLKNRIAADEVQAGKLRENVRRAAEAYRKLEELVREAEAEEKNSFEKYQLLARENGDFASEQETIAKRLQEIDHDLIVNTKKGEDLTAQIDLLSENRKNRDSTKAALQSEITALKVETAEQGQIVAHQKEKAEQSAARVDDMNASVEALRSSVNGIHSELKDQSESQKTLEQQVQAAKLEKERLGVLLAEKKDLRRSEQETLSEEEQFLKEKRRELDHLSDSFQEENMVLSRLDVQLDHLLDTLSEDYELTIEAAREKYPLKIDVAEARKRVKLIKLAIEELGTVNLGAIDEYDEVSERERFLTAQRDDLLKARTTLENVMTEMDREVGQRFSKTFKMIREQFQIVFQELFGGGRADLKLIDPDDLLSSGIEILAEPPGKKLQRLSLLSGGERALTAIALLFAILKVRPVPFCVLDEVEAALDDANVDRYAGFLKKFSAETQFIVVTHRHGTMEHADVLYGVTMQESGVSRLVSVRLEETQELISANR